MNDNKPTTLLPQPHTGLLCSGFSKTLVFKFIKWSMSKGDSGLMTGVIVSELPPYE